LSVVVLLVSAIAVNAQAPTPVANEPHHHVVVKNEYVNAYHVFIGAHDATLLHQHDLPYLFMSVGPADITNAVLGKPEAQLKATDGQVFNSPGHFAHVARPNGDTSFTNITVEFLHPQGTPHNLCVKVVEGPVKDCSGMNVGDAMRVQATPLFETDEFTATSVSLAARVSYTDDTPQQPKLVMMRGQSEVKVTMSGGAGKTLRSGEIVWIPGGASAKITATGAQANSRFVLLSFKK
jgi:hypothetical protein